MRVFLPTTYAGVRTALVDGEVVADIGFAVTPALREWYTEGDAEQLEYLAGADAAAASLRLLVDAVADAAVPPRRVVLAVELPDAATRPAPEVARAAVRLAAPVPWRAVESALVDDADAEDDVRRAVSALSALSALRDHGAAAAVTEEALEKALDMAWEDAADHEPGWWAVQELAALVAP